MKVDAGKQKIEKIKNTTAGTNRGQKKGKQQVGEKSLRQVRAPQIEL